MSDKCIYILGQDSSVCLRKTYPGIPEEFGEDDERCGREVDASIGGSDAEDGKTNVFVLLEFITEEASLLWIRSSVNAHVLVLLNKQIPCEVLHE